jgi:hypothetical protein
MDIVALRSVEARSVVAYLLGLTLRFGWAARWVAATYDVCDHVATCNAGQGSGWQTGSDRFSKSQAQSKTTPWKTIDQAEEHVAGGDTVIVGDGVYNTGAAEWNRVVV